jgi:hypothetical protein
LEVVLNHRFGRLIIAALSVTAVASAVVYSDANAAPTPVETPSSILKPLEKNWAEIPLRVDMRNLTSDGVEGKISEAVLQTKLEAANGVWSQCSIRFIPRKIENVNAKLLEVPYRPQSQGDLSLVHGKIAPGEDHDSIPLTVAGPWTFYDQGSGLYLHGLGWVFLNGNGKPINIGAMIGSNLLGHPQVGSLIGHELGHALSLSHSSLGDNVMAGGNHLTMDQCNQARGFAEQWLTALRVTPAAAATKLAQSTPSSLAN